VATFNCQSDIEQYEKLEHTNTVLTDNMTVLYMCTSNRNGFYTWSENAVNASTTNLPTQIDLFSLHM